MKVSPRKKADWRRDATRIALIEAAERLFGEAGVAVVSARQIGTAIGSANNTVVAYHFGNKEGLVTGVYQHRLPTIDARRGELLDAVVASGNTGNLAALLRALWLPLFEQTDEVGRHSYARFLASLIRGGLERTRRMVNSDYRNTRRLLELALGLLPPVAEEVQELRLYVSTNLMLSALAFVDTQEPRTEAEKMHLFECTIDMAVAAFSADIGAR